MTGIQVIEIPMIDFVKEYLTESQDMGIDTIVAILHDRYNIPKDIISDGIKWYIDQS